MFEGLSVNELLQTAASSGLSLASYDAESLMKGNSINLRPESIAATGKCNGIKIADLPNGCALYLNPFALPPTVTVCCAGDRAS